MLKKSKEKIIKELNDAVHGIYVDPSMFSYNSPDSVMSMLDNHIKLCIITAVEIIINNAYCQDDFEKDVGVRDEHENT